ncbi:MAG: hypothetical protein EHM70_17330 [Chloroflexota bacterium]|nr:MAG: hypothetical protein EHM70_17330 [Chloroflexota bacterium]
MKRITLYRLRLIALALGAAILLWLPFEDQTDTLATLLSAALCIWFAVRYSWADGLRPSQLLIRAALVWAIMGLLVSPLAALLLVFKIGLHSHSYPDFTPGQILAVLYRTPVWIIAGLLAGLGTGLFRMARSMK